MLDFLHKKIYDFFVQPFLKRYLQKTHLYKYENLKLKIYPGIFHPAWFFSTQVFVEFIKTLDLRNKKVCEVGAGSGLLSFVAFIKEADIYSLDINSVAVNGIKENFNSNFKDRQHFIIYHSDLFDDVPKKEFDFFFINPPYFFNDPKNDSDFAWYCGKNGEYFEKLFKQIKNYSNASSQIFMSLAENCDLERIKTIAKKHSYLLNLTYEKKIKWEKNFIFKIIKSA